MKYPFIIGEPIKASNTKRKLHSVKLQSWWIHKSGYVVGRVWTAQGQRYVRKHRFVMECHLGRYLTPQENVHHIDGNKLNNDITNLEIMDHAEHSRHHSLGVKRSLKARENMRAGWAAWRERRDAQKAVKIALGDA